MNSTVEACDERGHVKTSNEFSVFSHFSRDEEQFVEEVMAEFLEELGFKICCHRRDFDLRIPIEENIAEGYRIPSQIFIL